MADANAIRRSADIAVKQGSSVVVVSATYGTTNRLVEITEAADSGNRKRIVELLAEVRASHCAIADDLAISKSSLNELHELLDTTETVAYNLEETARRFRDDEMSGFETDQSKTDQAEANNNLFLIIQRLRDRLFGMGERMSSLLITDHLNHTGHSATCLDAGKVIRTDDRYTHAVPQFDTIEELCELHIHPVIDGKQGHIVVTQGFVGKTSEGYDTTLGRGGSDYSAAILAWGLDADILQIWTDVSGMSTTDPRIVPDAQPISEISFQEAAELATFGAKILHPSTLIPAIWKEIPVFVGSSIRPENGGTWIYREVGKAPLVRALAIRRNQALLTLTTTQMLNTYGFLYRIFRVFNDHRVSVDSITTSEISVAMTVDDKTLRDRALISDLEDLGQLNIEESYELISLIGNNINHTAGLAQKVFTALSDINVRMICQGASRHNFCFLVDEGRGEQALRKLHTEFIG